VPPYVDQRLLLITLLVKLGVAAAVAAGVVRSRYFKLLLFNEERNLRQQIYLVLFMVVPFALGVLVRLNVRNFLAADLSFESSLLMGVMIGRAGGVLGASLVSLPAMLSGELATLPFNVAAAFVAGVLRRATSQEEIWSFSPFFDLSIYRWTRKMLRHPQIDWQMSFTLVILAFQVARIQLGNHLPGEIFYLDWPRWAMLFGIYASTVATVAVPIKVWNSTRIELKLEEQERMLLQARMEALQNQINPHFLFNTLNSVSSLVRFDPDTARVLIVKLANILRRLLRKTESFVPLREELDFVDDFLAIEVVRFGPEKLKVAKDLDPATLDTFVPAMLLQPLVENSIKHGIAPKIEGGTITLRSRAASDRLTLEVEDDGVGMSFSAALGANGSGIGMSNVAERLKVLYGNSAHMSVSSRDGIGTLITLELPLVDSATAEPLALAQDARSITLR
jgi:two-component system, LytTR family, sensor kinase